MERVHDQYPDVSDVHAQKTAGRRRRAALSYSQKLAEVDALKARVQPIIQARIDRKQRHIHMTLRSA